VRALPRRIEWGPASVYHAFGFHQARTVHMCHHIGEQAEPLPGPCVGRVQAGEYYLSAEHGPRSHQTKIAFRCAVTAGLVTDTRMTRPLLETMLCAEHWILLWRPEDGCDCCDVWIRGDDGVNRFSQVAQDAANWLRRNGFAGLSNEDRILLTVPGVAELAAWRHEQGLMPAWRRASDSILTGE
jgi:hypothetical protein